jgi:hypothetical protein
MGNISLVAQYHGLLINRVNLTHGHVTLTLGKGNLAISEETLALVQQLNAQMQKIQFSKEQDVLEVSCLLQQRTEENLDQPFKNASSTASKDKEPTKRRQYCKEPTSLFYERSTKSL